MRSTSSLAFGFTQLLLVVFTASRTAQGYDKPSRASCLGCEIEQNINDPIYYELATESLEQYVTNQGLIISHRVVKVTKATTQVVAGLITRLTFNALLGSRSVTCSSEILEPPTEVAKHIKVTCMDNRRQVRQVPGGHNEKDANDPKYRYLAEESLEKYVADSGLRETYEVVKVKKVTEQVVTGTITRIVFDAIVGSSTPLNCYSEILEQPWHNVKDIKITCDTLTLRKKDGGIPGGITEEDPNDPVYAKLAEESLAQYKHDKGLTECAQLLQVVKVTSQLVAGTMTRIDFIARLGAARVITCHSEIWEQPWINRKEITVNCI